ncbi:hypothetical protein ACQ86N_01600 [Puia sp. P3]|uniref:hypothetical protein n=1 Tax=Puia sp. P3 TaxID=3423952 RepID=UPI003D679877
MRRLEFNSDVRGAGAAGGDRWGFGLSGARRVAVGLAAVIFVYVVYKLVLCAPGFLEGTSRSLRHFMKFGIAIVVYGLGVFAFFRNSQGWVLSVWHILYVGMLVLLTLLGVFDAVGGGCRWWRGD